MKKVFIIISREYFSRVKKKSFILMSLLTPLLFISIPIITTLLASNTDETSNIAIVNHNSILSFSQEENEYLKFLSLEIEDKNQIETYLEVFDAVVYIPSTENVEELSSSIEIFSKKQLSLQLKNSIKYHIEDKLKTLKLTQFNIDPKLLSKAEVKVKLQGIIINEKGQKSEGNSEISYGLALLSGFLIYIFIFMYGAMIMRSVIEEKTNRIVEVIISSVQPFQLMISKIIGVALVGLTQFLIWIILGLILFALTQSMLIGDLSDSSNPELIGNLLNSIDGVPFIKLITAFVFFFLGGYLLYGSLFAAIGSGVDQETDTQQFMLPLTIPLIISFIFVQIVADNPDSTVSQFLSIFPLTSPILMMVRIPFGVEWVELIASILVLIFSFIFTTWLAAKIYRTGILMYGKKFNYKEVWKWIKFK